MTTERQQYLVTIEFNQRGLLNYELDDQVTLNLDQNFPSHMTTFAPTVATTSPTTST